MAIASTLAALVVAVVPNYQQILDRFLTEQEIPGTSAVVTHQNRVLFSGASGLADIETGQAMTADTILYAGSLSKILTSVMTLNLVAEGKLSLDDVVLDVRQQIPGESAEISVFHLLTHKSGLDREGSFGYWYTADFPDATALARYLIDPELRFTPGESTHYSNVGYAALGAFVARTSAQDFGEVLRSRVLLPLGMTSSGAPGPAPDVARGYTPVGRVMPNDAKPFAGLGRSVGKRHLREYHDAKAMTPAFGAYTNASDMGLLVRFLLGFGADDVLTDQLRRQILTPQKSARGLGLRIGRLNERPVARHDGWFAAHRSHLLLDLQEGIGVVVLANSDNAAPALIAEALLAVALEFEPGMQQTGE